MDWNKDEILEFRVYPDELECYRDWDLGSVFGLALFRAWGNCFTAIVEEIKRGDETFLDQLYYTLGKIREVLNHVDPIYSSDEYADYIGIELKTFGLETTLFPGDKQDDEDGEFINDLLEYAVDQFAEYVDEWMDMKCRLTRGAYSYWNKELEIA